MAFVMNTFGAGNNPNTIRWPCLYIYIHMLHSFVQTINSRNVHIYIYTHVFVVLTSLTYTSCTVPFMDYFAARNSNKVIQGLSFFIE